MGRGIALTHLNTDEEDTMRPKDLTTFLTAAMNARHPVLVTGAPGIGKSQIIEQAAKAVGADVILSHPVVEDPTDAKGLPWPDMENGNARFLPFGATHKALTATTLTAWFLDDLGQAMPATQAAYMQWLLARESGGHRLPDCVTFVSATNRRTDKAGVSGILEPVKSRFVSIVELEPHVDDWVEWAIGATIAPELIAYLRFAPESLCAFNPSADMTNSPTPRTWKHVNDVLNMKLPNHVEHAGIAGAVGEGAAAEFIGFLRVYEELPRLDEILKDPEGSVIPTKPSALYAVSTGLASKVTVDNIGSIGRYAERLLDAGYGEFSALLLRDCIKREKKLHEVEAFIRLMVGPIGNLISGGPSND